MSRLQDALCQGGKLIAFIVAGDPTFEKSVLNAGKVIEAGADVLELGLPFSDPLADGRTIQDAGQRAMKSGMNTDRYFELAKRVHSRYDTPLVCLTYYNLVLQYGLARFARACRQSGIDGVILPDLPIEEASPLRRKLRANGVDFIFLVAETTNKTRMRRILAEASGFIYVVGLLGTTGARTDVSPALKPLLKRIRRMATVPVAVGFGINTPKHVKTVIRFGAQAAIVGSGIVDAIFKGEDFTGYVRSLKDAAEDS